MNESPVYQLLALVLVVALGALIILDAQVHTLLFVFAGGPVLLGGELPRDVLGRHLTVALILAGAAYGVLGLWRFLSASDTATGWSAFWELTAYGSLILLPLFMRSEKGRDHEEGAGSG